MMISSATLIAAETLPSDAGAGYVVAAYIVFAVLLAIYVGIMAARLASISRQLGELAELAERRAERPAGADRGPDDPDDPAERDPDREEARA